MATRKEKQQAQKLQREQEEIEREQGGLQQEEGSIEGRVKVGVGKKYNVHWIGLFVALFAGLLYLNTSNHGYVLDDYSAVKANFLVQRGFEGVAEIFDTHYRYGFIKGKGTLYRPLSLITLAIEWEFWPESSSASHISNIFMYMATGYMLFLVLSMIFSGYNFIFPLLVSLLFIGHPIHTEVVANIKSRDEILALLFCLVSLYFLWKHVSKQNFVFLGISLFSFFLAFLSKESAITYIGIVAITLYFFTNISIKKIAINTLLFIIPAAMYLGLRSHVLGDVKGLDKVSVLDNILGGAANYSEELATAIFLMGKYLWLLILPVTMASDYSFDQIVIVNWNNLYTMLSILAYIGIIIIAVRGIKTKSIVAYGILFFFVSMSIFSNIINTIGSSFAERFVYAPALGFVIVLGWIILKMGKVDLKENVKISDGLNLMKKYALSTALIAVILGLYSFRTIDRNADWESSWTLYSQDVKNSPKSARMRYLYGMEVMNDRAKNATDPVIKNAYLDTAIVEIQSAINIHPKYANAYERLAMAYYRRGDNNKALENYYKAIEINPNMARTYSNMAIIYFNNKMYQEAIDLYIKAVYYDPSYSDAYFNLGSCYGLQAKYDLAILNFNKALEFDPANANIYSYMAMTYTNMGDKATADQYNQKAEEFRAR